MGDRARRARRGLNGVAAPVLDGARRCHGALGVSGPTYRVSEEALGGLAEERVQRGRSAPGWLRRPTVSRRGGELNPFEVNQLTREELLKRGAGLAVGTSFLGLAAACGGDDEEGSRHGHRH